MHAMAKMANLTKNRQRTGKNVNEITRGTPCKVEKLAKMANVAKIRHGLRKYSSWMPKFSPWRSVNTTKIVKTSEQWQKWGIWEKNDQRVEGGYFGENGKYGEHPPMFWQKFKWRGKGALWKWRFWRKWRIWRKMTNLAKIRQRCGETSNEMLKRARSIVAILKKIAFFLVASLNMWLEFSLNLWRIFAKFAIFVVACISGHISKRTGIN